MKLKTVKGLQLTTIKTKNNSKKAFELLLNDLSDAFTVKIDDLSKAKKILKFAKQHGLLISPVEVEPEIGQSFLSFFFSNGKYDVTYIEEPSKKQKKNLLPTYSVKNEYYTIRLLISQAATLRNDLQKALKKEGVRGKLTLRQLITVGLVIEGTYDTYVLSVVNLSPSYTCVCVTVEEEEDDTFTHKDVDNYVYESDHYVQVGTKFYFKGENDEVIYDL